MNKLLYILLFHGVFVFHVSGQNIFHQIKEAFQLIDSGAYIDKACVKDCQSLWGKKESEDVKKCYQWHKNYLANTRVIFLLNIDVDSALVHTGNYVKIDTSEYNFTLVFFDKKWRYKDDICFVDDKVYIAFAEYTGAVYGKKFVSGYERIIKRNPKYMLYCLRLSSTILYIPNNFDEKIMVYNIWDEKTYELGEYLKKLNNKNAPAYYYEYKKGTIEELGNW